MKNVKCHMETVKNRIIIDQYIQHYQNGMVLKMSIAVVLKRFEKLPPNFPLKILKNDDF